METKLSKLLHAMKKGEWNRAISIAAKFPRLGAHKITIQRAHESFLRPCFQRQIGKDPDKAIQDGILALKERYGKCLTD